MDYKKALSKCMQICSKAECCSFDITQKLQKWEVASDDQQKIIQYLYLEKFLNDERYVHSFVNDKFRFNRWGKIKINFMLKQKKIQSELIYNALDAIDEDAYVALIKEELIKKYRTVKAKDAYDKKIKVVRYLASKGFESELIYKLYDKQVNNY